MLELLFNHVVLPPRLPGRQDDRIEDIESGLITRVLLASRTVRDIIHTDFREGWDSIRRSLQTCKAVNIGGKIDKSSLLNELRCLENEDAIILHISQQNAGLLIRHQRDGLCRTVVFEAFEASPLSEQVLASGGALQWDFPGCAVSMPHADFKNSMFQSELAAFLDQASRESIKRFAAQTNKAGSSAYESRDTVDPSLISQMLMTLLEANGQRLSPSSFRKRIRDDVCWTDGAEKPWRRCAIWLVLRVAVQRRLSILFGDEAGRIHYKFFICLVLTSLLDDSLAHLTPDLLHILKSKLCRRIAKLEGERARASSVLVPLYEHMFGIFVPIFEKSTKYAIQHIEDTWQDFRRSIRKRVLPLKQYAEQNDLYLTLPNSGNYLQQVMTQSLTPHAKPRASFPWQLLHDYLASTATTARQLEVFTELYFSLSQIETEIELTYAEPPISKTKCEQRCVELGKKIEHYLNATTNVYNSNPEQQSVRILTAMELWMSMDKCAIQICNLISHYSPGFPPEILDVLHLSRFEDMSRLQRIQQYLKGRLLSCNGSRMTIFSDPRKGCFAERYFDESQDSDRLRDIHRQIVDKAEAEREKKVEEWRAMSAKYEALVMQIAGSSCLFRMEDSVLPAVQVHDDIRCSKCFLERASRRMRIEAYEDPLPSNTIFAKTVVFELCIPKALAIYRDTTWKILTCLGFQNQTSSFEPRLLLREYPALRGYNRSNPCNFSLASTAKSFLMTHYAKVGFPAALDSVILPNGLRYSYYDTVNKVWPGQQTQKPSFAHLCQLVLPKSSPFSSIQSLNQYALGGEGASSYEVIASQSRCPLGLNVHEFMAFQSLLSGKNRRWPAILIELGSSNLNFSSESVAALVSHLATESGPALEGEPRRSMHKVFMDESFCQRLVDQLDQRLESISPNFREIFCMDLLITLLLRLHSLASESTIKTEAAKLIRKARSITHSWTGLLRSEVHKAKDAAGARKWSDYAFMSALLCRRTFEFHVNDDNLLNKRDLGCFIECSITLQNSMASDPMTLAHLPKVTLIRDLKLAYRMRSILRESLKASMETLMSAVATIWPEPAGVPRVCSALEFLPAPHEWWVEVTIEGTNALKQQVIHYNLLRGILLVDGSQLGKLPREHQESVILKQLFGNQSLLIYPSSMPGMIYTLGFLVFGHQIHLGFRNNSLVIRTYFKSTVLELVPNTVFSNRASFDLPAELIDNCIHWLDLATGIIEVRRQPEIWKSKIKNWRINVNSRMSTRKNVTLVDPQSLLFDSVAQVFDRFEYRRQLTVFQPARGPLQVECRRLELSFFVNKKKLLHCRQLKAEIDLNQDAGTWYGLNSKLVLRDILNPRLRSIIIPMGTVIYRRNGFHVTVEIVNDGSYGRFMINEVLGRLECAAEPRLFYLKAYLHACTSSTMTDPLTQRTGTEEALHTLNSGYCQPWTQLGVGPHGILMEIAKLTPLREYYPREMKVTQRVFWNQDLTTAIQHDKFRQTVEEIIEKSMQLSIFASEKIQVPQLEHRGDMHLENRSYARRAHYERCDVVLQRYKPSSDLVYNARDCLKSTQSRLNVFESVSAIRACAPGLPYTANLVRILHGWANIAGYNGLFDKTLLSDRLDVDLASHWGSLVNRCQASSCKGEERYYLMFLIGTIAFRKDVDMDVIRVLIAFSILEDLKVVEPPKWPYFIQFRENLVPHESYLIQLIKPFCMPYPGDARSIFELNMSSKQRRTLEAMEIAHEQQIEADSKAFARFLLNQWPCRAPVIEDFAGTGLIDIASAMEVICGEWQQMYQNFELSQHIHQVQLILDRHRAPYEVSLPIIAGEEPKMFRLSPRVKEFPTLLSDLLRRSGPIPLKPLDRSSLDKLPHVPTKKSTHEASSQEFQDLARIIESLAQSKSTVRQQYAADLKKSLSAVKLLKDSTVSREAREGHDLTKLSAQISAAMQAVNKQYDQIFESFEKDDASAKWLQAGGLFPAITTITLLESLRSISSFHFGCSMKESILNFASLITNLQRLLRIEDAFLKENTQKIEEEQANSGHSNWNTSQYTDWVLLEIDANMLIRPEQVEVALATINPSSRRNSVLQMNMGQGKTSCILPMVAAILADSKKLMRVIIPKPLLLQTAQLLHARLGGLLGREIRHVPFSRKTPTTQDSIKPYFKIHKDILQNSGVMLALSEHILSFKLSGLQRLSDGRIAECYSMIKIQAWINKLARDIIDECDYTLAVRTQLIYPSGSQTTVDGHPHRWETAETLLHLVEGHLFNLQEEFPQSIEVVRRPQGGFPTVFFLRRDVENALISLLVRDICSGRTSIVQTKHFEKSDRLAIRKFISQPKIETSVSDRIHVIFSDKPAEKQNVFLLRGLLVHRILLLCLKKRWQVQYGIHPQRDPIAVPFQAKGLPSEQAEFGHVDVAVLLTILAFYHQGLNLSQLRQSLEHVVKSDDPSSTYNRWMQTVVTLPGSLREWNIINTDDEAQLLEIWQHARNNVIVVDYFLNNFVFPKHAKQFHMKLQASGWDIPLFLGEALQTADKAARGLTTGFSGTNDNKRMLPLTITQDDLPSFLHTSASVLITLLQPRNREYVLAADARGRHISELEFLKIVSYMGIQVLIDAGAMILELDNLSLAKAWLNVFTTAPAAIYFDKENKAWVWYRNGHQIPFLASPFVDNLGECLVYIDEAHTRGTDLKLPADARGALTLGPGITKDATVQAAMRLRQLATTQSITFFAPPEVHQSILDVSKKKYGDIIDSYDVICWLLEQTCDGIEQLQPLFYSQGVDFCRRLQASYDNPNFLDDSDQRQEYLSALRQFESQTLEQLYDVRTQTKPFGTSMSMAPEIASFVKDLNIRRKGFQDAGNAVHGSALQEVEQEREVAFEVEAVREVKKPVNCSPLAFAGLHIDIIGFVETGRLAAGSSAYEQVFVALRRTALGIKYGISSDATASRLYVSTEFMKTVILPRGQPNDNFQRQVNWVLWSCASHTALIINPEEAERILPLLDDAQHAITHLLTYAAPVTRKMLHFNDLKYYAIPALPKSWTAPSWLKAELGIFAGRLYFDYDEYVGLCNLLGVRGADGKVLETTLDDVDSSDEQFGTEQLHGDMDNTLREDEVPMRLPSFTKKPLTFLHEWLTVRRKGQDFAHTPMGYICQGRPLTMNHPFFAKADMEEALKAEASGEKARGVVATVTVGDADEIVETDENFDEDVYYTEEDGDHHREDVS